MPNAWDMATFVTAAHLALPDRGQSRAQRVRRGGQGWAHHRRQRQPQRRLGIAAMAAARKKDSFYGVYYRRLAARRGRQRAPVVRRGPASRYAASHLSLRAVQAGFRPGRGAVRQTPGLGGGDRSQQLIGELSSCLSQLRDAPGRSGHG